MSSFKGGPEENGAAVFLDRDGVVSVEGGEYVVHPDALRLLPGALDAIARLTQAGWPVFLFTNQAGVGRGFLTLETLNAIHARLRTEIEAAGGALRGIYACPHAPGEGCNCRKPRPGLLHCAAAEHALDLTRCYVIGDTPRDIAAGNVVGCRTILVLTGHTNPYAPATFPPPPPDYVFADLPAAAAWLCNPQSTEKA